MEVIRCGAWSKYSFSSIVLNPALNTIICISTTQCKTVYVQNIVSLKYNAQQCKYTKYYLYKTMHYRVDTHCMTFEDKMQDTLPFLKLSRHFSLRIGKQQPNSEFDNINIKTQLGIVTNFKKQLSKFPFLWDMTLRQCVIGFRIFERSYCSHIQGSIGHRIFFLSSILL